MTRHIFLLLILTLVTGTIANAQSVSESWLRQAAISCGGGQTEEVRAEVETKLIAQFQAVGEKRQDNTIVGDVTILLKQFGEQAKSDAYRSYSECLKGLVELVVGSSGLPAREVFLDADVAVAGLTTAKRGDRLLMLEGDTVALINWSIIFTVDKIEDFRGSRTVWYTWSNSETGSGESRHSVSQGENILIGDACTLVPYSVDVERFAASIIVNCKDKS